MKPTKGSAPAPAAGIAAPVDDVGLACSACGCRHLPVVYTRPKPGRRIMRRRECRNCGRRVTTFERF